ncbi:hypothetical protein Rhein_0642 [Rheinheimera sp. A13L]|nr:hypothetical protein Rhein_0642 [Rheinheimera sp. A13L]
MKSERVKKSILYRGVPLFIFLLILRTPDALYFDIDSWLIAFFAVLLTVFCYFFDKKL